MRSVHFLAGLTFAASPLLAQRPQLGTGPFGLPMGTTLAQLASFGPTEESDAKGFYKLRTVPKPHEDFETYIVAVSEKQGLCKIMAIGKDVSTSAQGYELRSAFESLDKILLEKYGDRKNFDFLNAGSIWDEPKDFMMGLVKKERTLSSYWDQSQGSHFTDHVNAITLETTALHSDVGYLQLRYEFENTKACLEEIAKKTNSSL